MGARRDRRDRRGRSRGRLVALAIVLVAVAFRQQRLDAADAAYPHIAHPR